MPYNSDYIGLTRKKLKKKLDSQYYNSSILKHYKEHHHQKLTKYELYNKITIIEKDRDNKKIFMKESLKISSLIQFLPLYLYLKGLSNKLVVRFQCQHKKKYTRFFKHRFLEYS